MAKKKTRLEAALSAARNAFDGAAGRLAGRGVRKAGKALTEAAGQVAGDVLSSAGKGAGSAVTGIVGNIAENSLLKRKKKTEAELPGIGGILGNIVENALIKKKKKTEAERIREQSGAAVSAEELRRLQTKPLE
jgi:hypothetical protein